MSYGGVIHSLPDGDLFLLDPGGDMYPLDKSNPELGRRWIIQWAIGKGLYGWSEGEPRFGTGFTICHDVAEVLYPVMMALAATEAEGEPPGVYEAAELQAATDVAMSGLSSTVRMIALTPELRERIESVLLEATNAWLFSDETDVTSIINAVMAALTEGAQDG